MRWLVAHVDRFADAWSMMNRNADAPPLACLLVALCRPARQRPEEGAIAGRVKLQRALAGSLSSAAETADSGGMVIVLRTSRMRAA